MRSSNKRLLSIFKQCCEKGTRERCHRPNSEVLARERERVGPVEFPGRGSLQSFHARSLHPPTPCAPDHFFLSVKSPSLTAAYEPAKKPMKLEPIVMIHGGSISDTTPMSMSRACSTAPPIVPPSQKTIQRTRMSVDCRATFVAAPKEPVPGYTLKQRSRTLIFAAFAALNYPGILLVWPPSGHISMFIRRAVNRGIKHGISQNA
jgi:hypothetical protein